MVKSVSKAGEDVHTGQRSQAKRAAFAAFMGTTLEYYDLMIYATASAIIFGTVFFPGSEPGLALILSFATFATGYIARPLGAFIFGYIGDVAGRKKAIMMTLLLMGFATVAMGLLPEYASIGIAAPIGLVILRLLQGIAVGGEVGGAMIIAVEHAPIHKRGFYGSFSTAGSMAGTVLATSVFSIVTMMPREQLMAWGWRVPFLLSALILLLGLFVRFGLDETPDFKATKADQTRTQNSKAPNPISYAFKHHFKTMVGITAISTGMTLTWYILSVYSLSYATRVRGIDAPTMLVVISVATMLVLFFTPAWGALSDKIGRVKTLTSGLTAYGILVFVYFAALHTENIVLIFLALLAATGLGQAVVMGVLPAFIVDTLPSKVRYTAGSIGFQMSAIFSGLGPLAATLLEKTVVGVWGIAAICMAFCVAGVFSVFKLTNVPKPSTLSNSPADTRHENAAAKVSDRL